MRDIIPVQLLPIRFPRIKIAEELTGRSWKELKMPWQQINLDGESKGGYRWKGNKLIAQKIHPDYQHLIGKNNNPHIRMCHHNDYFDYCGRCFLDKKGFIIPAENIKVDYNRGKFKKSRWRKERRNKWKDKFQRKLELK